MNVDAIKEKLLNSISPEPNTGCWLWTSYGNPFGYGQTWYRNKTRLAHRVVYEIFVSEIGAGLSLCHKCDTPACVNPNHMFVGTHHDNMRDMAAKGRGVDIGKVCREKKYCANGHPYSGSNLILVKKGRQCRTCAIAATKRYRAKHTIKIRPANNEKTHCLRGHELVFPNISKHIFEKIGKRRCMICQRETARKRKEARKG